MRSIPSHTLRDAADSNQRVSRFCEPLPTAVIPIRAEAVRCLWDLTFRSYSLLISFFYTKVPFVLGAGVRQLSRLTGVSFGVVQKLTK